MDILPWYEARRPSVSISDPSSVRKRQTVFVVMRHVSGSNKINKEGFDSESSLSTLRC